MRSTRRIPVLILLCFVALASCGGDDRDAGRSGADNECPSVALASMSALTGSEAGLGRAVARGAELAVARFAEERPECSVRLEQIDTEGLPEPATVGARRIAEDDAIIGVVGPAFSSEVLAAGNILDDAGLTFVTPSATARTLSEKGWSGFHRVVASDAVLGAATAAFVAGLPDAGSFAVVDDGSAFGSGLADAAERELGSKVTVSRTVAQGSDDLGATIDAINAADVGTVFFAGYLKDSTAFTRALRESGNNARLIVSEGAYNPRLLSDAGRAADGVLIVTSTAPASTVPEFAAAYRTRFGANPPAFAAEGYDAAGILLAAIAEGARSRAEVAEFVANADSEGITRRLKWDSTGEPMTASFRLVKAADGAFIDQGPVPAAG